MIATFLAEASPLTTPEGQATAAGLWLLLALGVIAFLSMLTNQILGILVKRKQLNAPPPTQQQIVQPLIVAMEKEFVTKHVLDQKAEELHRYIKNVDSYAHEEVHAIRDILQATALNQQVRNERLASLEADSKTHRNGLRDLNLKVDAIVKNVGDKVEQLIRDGVIRGGHS